VFPARQWHVWEAIGEHRHGLGVVWAEFPTIYPILSPLRRFFAMPRAARTINTAVAVALLLAVAGLTASAQAQAGGGGRLLERDLRQPGTGAPGGLTPRKSLLDEVRLRNALVTGNVGGLRSFRGNVGYTAPDDFRGQLASDSTFTFRRDSASASSLRGVNSLRYQTTFSTGNQVNPDSLVSRIGATGAAAATAAPGTSDTFSRQRAFKTPTGALRSSATFTANESLTPALVGYTRGEDGVSKVTASSLLGVRKTRQEEIKPAVPGMPSLLKSALPKPSDSINTNLQENLQPTSRLTAYDNLRDRMKKADEEKAKERATAAKSEESGEKSTDIARGVDAQLESLRKRLIPDSSRLRDEKGRSIGARESAAAAEVETPPAEVFRKDGEDKKPRVTPLTKEELEAIDLIRRSRAQANTFIDPVTGKRDFFAEHIATGEKLLGEERYFDAEERFALALSIKPGDVNAQAARIHAQMGAGLYLSAAFNLRNLLAANPEVAAIRFTGATVPNPDRLASLAADLRGKIAVADARKEDPLSSDGLMLAYIGHQVDNKELVREGLDVMKRGTRSKAEQASVTADQSALVDLLEKVWME
jgi:hypothetical protein